MTLANTTYHDIHKLFNKTFTQHSGNETMGEVLTDLNTIETAFTAMFSELKAVSLELSKHLDEKKQMNADAAYYRIILQKVSSDATLRDMWTDFLMTLKLTNPEIEEEFRQAANSFVYR